MIRVTNLDNADYKTYDESWAIVQSMKTYHVGLQQVRDLAPSLKLFYDALSLKQAGQWDEESFAKQYTPRFIRELKDNPFAKQKLDYLKEQSAAGKKIQLLCFCDGECLCHRSIVGGILQGMGCEVVMDTDNDYIKYYELYSGKQSTVGVRQKPSSDREVPEIQDTNDESEIFPKLS